MRPSATRVAARWLQAKKRLVVYRAHYGRPDLTDANAANLMGIVIFLQSAMDMGPVNTDAPYLSKFVVEIDGEFGPYQYFQRGRADNPLPGPPQVGVKEKGRGGRWFSFPKGGPWRVSSVKTAPMGEGRTRGGPDPGKPGVLFNEAGYLRDSELESGDAEAMRWVESFF